MRRSGRWLALWVAPGAQQMALDEALLDEVAAGRAPSTVRCFLWQSPCITLGRFQGAADLDLGRCAAAGLSVVRRPTGGAAVLHGADLGYAIVLSPESVAAIGGAAALYESVGRALAAALMSVGLPAETRSGQVGRPSGACFASLGPCEVVVDGFKVAGSAQLRRRGAVLQHGSLYPDGGAAGIAPYLASSGPLINDAAADRLALLARERARDLSAQLRLTLADSLGIELVRGAITATEEERARVLLKAKYCASAWNLGR